MTNLCKSIAVIMKNNKSMCSKSKDFVGQEDKAIVIERYIDMVLDIFES